MSEKIGKLVGLHFEILMMSHATAPYNADIALTL